MRRFLFLAVMFLMCANVSFAQQSSMEDKIRQLVPYDVLKQQVPGLTPQDYEARVTQVAHKYLGTLSANPYSPNSTSNPYGAYGSPYSSKSINNPYGTYGSPYSPQGVTNPYSNSGPSLYGRDGQYLGRVNSNPYDPQSVSNPYGRYGSPYSPTSIKNPYSRYGSPYSPYSATNPYTTQAPLIFDDEK